jgi:hypothetical protein
MVLRLKELYRSEKVNELRSQAEGIRAKTADFTGIEEFSEKFSGLKISDLDVFKSTVVYLVELILVSPGLISVKSYFKLLREILVDHGVNACTADDFVLASAWIDCEISTYSSMLLLRGMGVDYRESRENRRIVDLHDITGMILVRNNIATFAAYEVSRESAEFEEKPKPGIDSVKSTELHLIESGYERLAKYWKLRQIMPDVIKDLADNTRLVVGEKYNLTIVTYSLVLAMAERDGLESTRKQVRHDDNNYVLNLEFHERVRKMASERGMTPRVMLNKLLRDFFSIIDKQSNKLR